MEYCSKYRIEPEATEIGITLKSRVSIVTKWCYVEIKIILVWRLYTSGICTSIASIIEHVAVKRASVTVKLAKPVLNTFRVNNQKQFERLLKSILYPWKKNE